MNTPKDADDHKGCPDDSGKAMVLLHGAGGNHLLWEEVRARLSAAGIPAVSIDLPGHGCSPLELTNDVQKHAEGVAGRLRDLGVRKAVVVGHSLGGAVALRLAVSGLISVGGVGVVSSGARLPVSEQILAGLLGNFPATVGKIAKVGFAKGTDPGRVAILETMLLDAGVERVHADFTACASYALTQEELRRIECPLSIVWGEQDVLVPLVLVEELAAALPTSVIRLRGIGHMPMFEAPGETASALLELWGKT